jgi:alpha-1,6-mannosyltransferase
MTLAPQFADKIQTLGVPNPSLVTQFVDLDLFTPALRSESLRETYGVTNDDLLLVYVGRFDSEKHVGTLVRMLHALPASPRAVLVMAGDGPMRGELEAEAQLDSRLRILPYIQVKEDLATLLASADVYTTAGPHEVAAFSVVEAQASGLPVVGVAAGGLLDRVPDDLGVLVPVDDALAMAEAVELLFAKRHTLRPRVRAYVEANYSWTRCFEQIVRLYESQPAASNT